MSTNLVLLAVLMFAVTYPSRAAGLLTPGLDRLPKIVEWSERMKAFGSGKPADMTGVEALDVAKAATPETCGARPLTLPVEPNE